MYEYYLYTMTNNNIIIKHLHIDSHPSSERYNEHEFRHNNRRLSIKYEYAHRIRLFFREYPQLNSLMYLWLAVLFTN